MVYLKKSIRKQVFSGSFYPDSIIGIVDFISSIEQNEKIRIDDLFASLKDQKVSGLIVPHAGWIYSGKTAQLAYKIVEKLKPQRVALLGPSHKFPINKVLADGHRLWATKLGNIDIIKDQFFETNTTYHAHEHALEVQAPFIKHFLKNTELLPLVVGEVSDSEAVSYAKHLLDHRYFLIVSTDLSHFHSIEEAKKIDAKTIRSIINLKNNDIEACGSNPLKIMIEFCKLINTTPKLIDYTTSAEATGDVNKVVGYASFWF